MNDLVHMKVFLTGRCTKCKHYNELQVYDYGVLPFEEQDAAMDHVKHSIEPIKCGKCGAEYPAEHIIYREILRKVDAVKQEINHDYIDPETSEKMLQGHDERYEIFAAREVEFWAAFTDYALDNWQAAVGELSKQEITEGFRSLRRSPILKTDLHARREALKVDTADRRLFWQAANTEFIKELEEIGAMGWTPDAYVKMFGPGRTRFGIMYFPIADALENLRTKYIGVLFKREKGDNAFLLRRIGQLTDDAHKQTVKYNKVLRQLDEQKHTIAALQDKLGIANSKITELSYKQPLQDRNSEDAKRIRELKSFVGELLTELRELRPDEPTGTSEAALLDEVVLHEKSEVDTSILKGKAVAIIGGYRARDAAGNYPCLILTHDGRKHDPMFYSVMQQADIIVLLTRFISHASMWEAKATALQDGKPIYFVQETNITRILNSVTEHWLKARFGVNEIEKT